MRKKLPVIHLEAFLPDSKPMWTLGPRWGRDPASYPLYIGTSGGGGKTQRLSHLTDWEQSLEGGRNSSLCIPQLPYTRAFPVSGLICVVDSDWQVHMGPLPPSCQSLNSIFSF